MAGIDYAASGIPTEMEYMRAYSRHVGRGPIDPSHWEFYLACSMLRLAAILQGIMKHALDGTASSAQALETGMRSRRRRSGLAPGQGAFPERRTLNDIRGKA